ncbi:Protein TIFY 11B [Hirschfeldia incana]|nr:Protein TIFY 11B [Hirschfeldia incana]
MSNGQAPEKSNFNRRCSLLSRYLKEKGSFGNIDIGLARKSDLELAGKPDVRAQQNATKKADVSKIRPFKLTQKKLSVGETSTSSKGKAIDVIDLSEPRSVPEPKTSQLTIFFGSKVIVYNEFPEDKAKEIIEAVKEANPAVVDDSKTTQKHMNLDMNINNKSNLVIPDLNEPTSSGNNDDHQTKEQHQVVERIARRASLHRFFSKRKDRAVARAPYQVNQNGGHLPPKPQMVGPSVEPGQPSRQPATPSKPKRHDAMSMAVDEEEGRCSKDLELKL